MKSFNATRSNAFSIAALSHNNLENKVFRMLVKVLVSHGKLLMADMSVNYQLAYNVETNVLAVSGKTVKGDEIVASCDVVDGAVDVSSIRVATEEGRVNLGKAVIKNPITSAALSVLLPGLLAASWVSFNRIDAESKVAEDKHEIIRALTNERDDILATLKSNPTVSATVRSNYRKQIDAIKAS